MSFTSMLHVSRMKSADTRSGLGVSGLRVHFPLNALQLKSGCRWTSGSRQGHPGERISALWLLAKVVASLPPDQWTLDSLAKKMTQYCYLLEDLTEDMLRQQSGGDLRQAPGRLRGPGKNHWCCTWYWRKPCQAAQFCCPSINLCWQLCQKCGRCVAAGKGRQQPCWVRPEPERVP